MKCITRTFMQEAFEHYCRKYMNIFSSFYPARGSSGFTEANQVHLFVNALVETLNDKNVIQWLEFPWADKRQHIDALVYSKKRCAVFYIEAKRLYNEKKRGECIEDMTRIISEKYRSIITEEHEIIDVDEFAICLCDVWLEDKWKKREMPSWWMGVSCKALSNDSDWVDVLDSKTSFIEEMKSNWPKENQFIKRFSSSDKLTEDCLRNYCIMMGFMKL